MNQKEATISTILSVFEDRGYSYELSGPTAVSEVLTDADKATVRETLFTMFRDGDVSYKPEFQAKVDNDAELKKYISGLLNNWIRKEKTFNSGQSYVAKNPGSRAHSSDEQMKELKKLFTQVSAEGDEDTIAQVTAAIEARKAEIKPKAAIKPINVEVLPEALRHLVSN